MINKGTKAQSCHFCKNSVSGVLFQRVPVKIWTRYNSHAIVNMCFSCLEILTLELKEAISKGVKKLP